MFVQTDGMPKSPRSKQKSKPEEIEHECTCTDAQAERVWRTGQQEVPAPVAGKKLRQLEISRPSPSRRVAPRFAQWRPGLVGARRYATSDGCLHYPHTVRYRGQI